MLCLKWPSHGGPRHLFPRYLSKTLSKVYGSYPSARQLGLQLGKGIEQVIDSEDRAQDALLPVEDADLILREGSAFGRSVVQQKMGQDGNPAIHQMFVWESYKRSLAV